MAVKASRSVSRSHCWLKALRRTPHNIVLMIQVLVCTNPWSTTCHPIPNNLKSCHKTKQFSKFYAYLKNGKLYLSQIWYAATSTAKLVFFRQKTWTYKRAKNCTMPYVLKIPGLYCMPHFLGQLNKLSS